MNQNIRFLCATVVTVAGLALTSCAAPPTAAAPMSAVPNSAQAANVTFKGADFSFEGPDQIPSGLTTIKFENMGKEIHHIQFARLNDGVTLAQLQDALKQGNTAALPLVTLKGGVAALDPGGNGRVTVDLPDGQYVLACFIPSADGVPHLAKGMLKPLKVVKSASDASAVVSEPKADVTVSLMDFHFTLPAEVKAGQQVWKIINDGPQPHELSLLRLAEGKTMQNALAWFEKPNGPPPFQSMGGMQGLTKDTPAAFLDLDMTPGNYVAVCFITDPATGKPHAALGMVMPFTVK